MRRMLLPLLVIASLLAAVSAQERPDASTLSKEPKKSMPASDGKAANGNRFDRVRQMIQKRMAETQVPSIAVAVARDGQILWEEGFGWADRENRVPATEHTMYSLASISKPVAATALMILKEQGRIDLDRPINDYLGEAKIKVRVGNPADATVRRVANHSSGLPLHYQFFYENEPYKPPSMDETILRYGNCVNVPGEKYDYSNLGYGILGYLVERVSNKSLGDFLRQDVFLPLGLTRASLDIGPGLETHHAIRYGQDGLPVPFYKFDHPAASAVYSSAHDLVRFGMFHLKAHLSDQKAILSDQAIDEMQKPTITTGTNSGYGIGWSSFKHQTGLRVVSHSGGMDGVSTMLILLPDEKVAIAALANSRTSLPVAVVEEIISVLFNTPVPPQQNQPPTEPVFKPAGELVGEWEGKVETYSGDTPVILRVFESGHVHVRLGRQLWALLNLVDYKNGYLTGRIMGDIGTPDASRRPHVLALSLKLRGNMLSGGMTALSTPGRRVGNALTHWIELKKK